MKSQDTLFCLILEQVIVQEWFKVIGEGAQDYTLVKPTIGEELVLYPFVRKSIGIVDHLAPKETWLRAARATKFDALAFFKFYCSIGYSVLLKEWELSNSDKLWMRYRTRKEKSSFSMTRPLEPLELDPASHHKLIQFRNALSDLYKKTQTMKQESKDLYQGGKGIFYQFWKDYTTYEGLPHHHRQFFDQLILVSAHIFYNILDSPERLKRATSISKKIPVSFLVTSLYFINPAPFMDKVMRLFVWEPAQGVYSFCQRLAGTICGHGRSKQKCDEAALDIEESMRAQLEEILVRSKCNSLVSLEEVRNILEEGGLSGITERHLEYAKLFVRYKEKQDFLDHLTGNTPSEFLDYMGKTMPLLLNELQKSVSLSQLVSKYFHMFQSILDCFPDTDTHSPEEQGRIIGDIVYHITQFMEFYYPVIHYTCVVHGTSKETPIITAIFDFIFGFLMQLDVPLKTKDANGSGYHEEVKTMFESSLNTQEKDALMDYLDKIESMCENGLDDRHWDVNDTISQVFAPYLLQQLQ